MANRLPSMKRCASCGAPNPISGVRCYSCGAPVPVVAAQSPRAAFLALFDRFVQRLASDRRARLLTRVALVVLFLCLIRTVVWITTIPSAPEDKGARQASTQQQAAPESPPTQSEPAPQEAVERNPDTEPKVVIDIGDIGYLVAGKNPEIPLSMTKEVHQALWKSYAAKDNEGAFQLIAAGLVTGIPAGTKARLIEWSSNGFFSLSSVIRVRVLEGPEAGIAGWTDANFLMNQPPAGFRPGSAGCTIGAPPGAYVNDYVPPKAECPSASEIADVAGSVPYRWGHGTATRAAPKTSGTFYRHAPAASGSPYGRALVPNPTLRGAGYPGAHQDRTMGQSPTTVTNPIGPDTSSRRIPWPTKASSSPPDYPSQKIGQGYPGLPGYSSSKAGAGYPGAQKVNVVRQAPMCGCGRRMLVGIRCYYCPSCKIRIPRSE